MYKVGDEVLVRVKLVEYSPIDLMYLCELKDGSKYIRFLSPAECIADKTYADGLNDAWELAKKIYTLEPDEREKMLGYQSMKAILEDLSAEYVADKIEAHEREKEINVGDVVANGKYICAVTNKIDENNSVILYGDGCFGKVENKFLKKTGKHIDIESLLRQIGE